MVRGNVSLNCKNYCYSYKLRSDWWLFRVLYTDEIEVLTCAFNLCAFMDWIGLLYQAIHNLFIFLLNGADWSTNLPIFQTTRFTIRNCLSGGNHTNLYVGSKSPEISNFLLLFLISSKIKIVHKLLNGKFPMEHRHKFWTVDLNSGLGCAYCPKSTLRLIEYCLQFTNGSR